MNISDETLMAYVDGELDPVVRAAVEAALTNDAHLASRLARQQALLAQLRTAFDDVLDEPVPPQLLAAIRASGNASAAKRPRVIDLPSRARAPRRWSWPQWSALAASLLVGALAGYSVPRDGAGELVTRNGQLEAHGSLAGALSGQLASDTPDATAPLRVGLSFLTKTGNYCRTFALAGTGDRQKLAGLACKDGANWKIPVLADAPAATDAEYHMAASALPDAVLRAVDDNIAGNPLDAAAERVARDKGWRR